MAAAVGRFRPLIPVFLVGYLALGGVVWVAAASIYLGEVPDPRVSLIFAGLVFGIYMVNRFTDRREDMANNGDRVWLMEHGGRFFHLGVLALVLSALILVAFQAMTAYHLTLILLGVAYSYRFLPWPAADGGIRFVRLKEIPLVKNIVVAFLWGSAVFIIPALFHGVEVTLSIGTVLMVAASIGTVFTNTVFCDVRDVTGDRLADNRTLPCTIGVPATYGLLAAVNVAVLGATVASLALGAADGGHLLYTLIAVSYPLVYIIGYERKWFSRTWLELVADSTPLVCAAGLILVGYVGA